jgi:hypothetical protein
MCLFGEIVSYIHGRKIAIIKGMTRYLFQKTGQNAPGSIRAEVGKGMPFERFGIN